MTCVSNRQSYSVNALSRAIDERAGKLGFDRHVAIDKTLAYHFEIAIALLQNSDLNPELVSRNDGLTKAAVVYSRKVDQLGIPALIAAEQKNDPHLSQRFDQKHSGHDGVVRKMSLEKRLIDGDVF